MPMPSNEARRNLLSNERLESFWDGLWLELWPFLYSIVESREIAPRCLQTTCGAISYRMSVSRASGTPTDAPTCSLDVCSASPSSLSTCVSIAGGRAQEEEHTICTCVCIWFSMEATFPEEDFQRGTYVQRCMWQRAG